MDNPVDLFVIERRTEVADFNCVALCVEDETEHVTDARARGMVKRYLIFFFGLSVMALGVAFSIKADLGTSPISSLPYAASEVWPVSVGVATILMHVAFILIQIAILRRRFPLIQLLQLPVGIAFGFMIDMALKLIDSIAVVNYGSAVAYCFLGILLVGVGVWLEVVANVVVLAGEGVVLAVSKVVPVKFGYLKIGFDWLLVLAAAALSYAELDRFVGIREGTLAAALGVGLVVRALNKWIMHR